MILQKINSINTELKNELIESIQEENKHLTFIVKKLCQL